MFYEKIDYYSLLIEKFLTDNDLNSFKNEFMFSWRKDRDEEYDYLNNIISKKDEYIKIKNNIKERISMECDILYQDKKYAVREIGNIFVYLDSVPDLDGVKPMIEKSYAIIKGFDKSDATI